MTYPRAHLVDSENGGFYHCISRCVRRSWLCGVDRLTGRSFEHRRAWLEERLLFLAELFSVNLYGYAVMSNHYHVVLETLPRASARWSDEEVARRWLRVLGQGDEEARVSGLVANGERVCELRQRLSSLSWFMRYINEPLARRANREDDCTGRFWEGRFKSFALLDEAAAVSCLAYVDLNPVRAEPATQVSEARHTSVRRRVASSPGSAAPLAGLERLGLRLSEYVALLESVAGGWRGESSPSAEPKAALARLGCDLAEWVARVAANRKHHRAYGAKEALAAYAEKLGQRWICAYRPKPSPGAG